MLAKDVDTGKAYILSDAEGHMGLELVISKRWDILPKSYDYGGRVGVHGPQYLIAAIRRNDYGGILNSLTVALSDQQMNELFHAWMVLRQEYTQDNPELEHRDKLAEAKRVRDTD